MNAGLVVLSACQTGLGNLVRGEGVVGLTRAFLYAGARRVAVSLWDVNDLTAPDFMQSFYRRLRQGEDPASALRSAKVEMLQSDSPVRANPYFWAHACHECATAFVYSEYPGGGATGVLVNWGRNAEKEVWRFDAVLVAKEAGGRRGKFDNIACVLSRRDNQNGRELNHVAPA